MTRRPTPSAGRPSTYSLLVPPACRSWARSRRIPLPHLLQEFVALGAHVIELLPPTVTDLPSALELLAAASVPTPDEPVLFGDAHGAPSDRPSVQSSRSAVPAVGASSSAGDGSESASGNGAPSDQVSGFARRLHSYGMSCRAVHPDIDADRLVYLVAAYAIALGVPAESSAACAELALGSFSAGPAPPTAGPGHAS